MPPFDVEFDVFEEFDEFDELESELEELDEPVKLTCPIEFIIEAPSPPRPLPDEGAIGLSKGLATSPKLALMPCAGVSAPVPKLCQPLSDDEELKPPS